MQKSANPLKQLEVLKIIGFRNS